MELMVNHTVFIPLAQPAQQAVGSFATSGGASTSSSAAITFPRTVGSPMNTGDAEFTLEMWLRPSATPADNGQTAPTEGANYSGTDGNIFWDADGFSTGRGFICGLDAGIVYLSVINGGSSRTEMGTTDIRDGNWHHVAVYRRASDGLMEIFVDGNREASIAGPTGDISYPGGGAATDDEQMLGKEKLNLAFGFDGDVSEVRMSTNRRYNGATYTVPTVPFTDDADTVGLYHFDQDAVTVEDFSGSADGTLIGSPDPTWSAQDPF
ncbi:MAG TPA: LamG-like jellyroll fold domain-containing protein [Steroidobacteraceae bacterium]|nr:LamG-like jellyroll fold domain-containing protein [Steroidobacteraceae bacterium]